MGPAPLAAGPGGAASPTFVTPIEGPLGPPMYPIDAGVELPASAAVLTGLTDPPSRLPDPIVSGCLAPVRSSRTKERAASGPVPACCVRGLSEVGEFVTMTSPPNRLDARRLSDGLPGVWSGAIGRFPSSSPLSRGDRLAWSVDVTADVLVERTSAAVC